MAECDCRIERAIRLSHNGSLRTERTNRHSSNLIYWLNEDYYGTDDDYPTRTGFHSNMEGRVKVSFFKRNFCWTVQNKWAEVGQISIPL